MRDSSSAQMVLHVLRRDARMKEWYRRIKKRRGAKIARVAAMRRLATIIWHMLKHQQPYRAKQARRPEAKPNVQPERAVCGCRRTEMRFSRHGKGVQGEEKKKAAQVLGTEAAGRP